MLWGPHAVGLPGSAAEAGIPVLRQAQLAPTRAGQGAQQPRASPRCCVPPRSPGGGSPRGLHGGSVAPQRGSRRAPSPRLHLRPGTLRALPRCGGEGSRDPASCWWHRRSPSAARGRPPRGGCSQHPALGAPLRVLVNGNVDVYQRPSPPSHHWLQGSFSTTTVHFLPSVVRRGTAPLRVMLLPCFCSVQK